MIFIVKSVNAIEKEFNKTFETVRKNVKFKMRNIDELNYQAPMKLNKDPLVQAPPSHPKKLLHFVTQLSQLTYVCFFQDHDLSEHWAVQTLQTQSKPFL